MGGKAEIVTDLLKAAEEGTGAVSKLLADAMPGATVTSLPKPILTEMLGASERNPAAAAELRGALFGHGTADTENALSHEAFGKPPAIVKFGQEQPQAQDLAFSWGPQNRSGRFVDSGSDALESIGKKVVVPSGRLTAADEDVLLDVRIAEPKDTSVYQLLKNKAGQLVVHRDGVEAPPIEPFRLDLSWGHPEKSAIK
jgi:hypothetical protein